MAITINEYKLKTKRENLLLQQSKEKLGKTFPERGVGMPQNASAHYFYRKAALSTILRSERNYHRMNPCSKDDGLVSK